MPSSLFRPQILLSMLLLAAAISTLCPCARAQASTPSREEAISKLRAWRSRVIELDQRADQAQKREIIELSKLTVKSVALASDTIKTSFEAIANRDFERSDLEAQRRIVDHLVSVVGSRWDGKDLRGFLVKQLLDLSVTDLAIPGQGSWWRFLIQSSIALRNLSEDSADPIKFLENLCTETGVLDPKSLQDVQKTLNYVG